MGVGNLSIEDISAVLPGLGAANGTEARGPHYETENTGTETLVRQDCEGKKAR